MLFIYSSGCFESLLLLDVNKRKFFFFLFFSSAKIKKVKSKRKGGNLKKGRLIKKTKSRFLKCQRAGFKVSKFALYFFDLRFSFPQRAAFIFQIKKKSDKMSCHFYYEDGQGKIVDEQGNDPMDWGENADIFI